MTPNRQNALYFFTTSMRVARPDKRTVRWLVRQRLIRKTRTIGEVDYYHPTRRGKALSDSLMKAEP